MPDRPLTATERAAFLESARRASARVDGGQVDGLQIAAMLAALASDQPELEGMPASQLPEPGTRARAVLEVDLMSRASVQEEGLLTIAGAARFLGVTQARIWRLAADGKLGVFEFDGRRYLSTRELRAWMGRPRDKGGRPRKKPLPEGSSALPGAKVA
jgi:hypothetical protein